MVKEFDLWFTLCPPKCFVFFPESAGGVSVEHLFLPVAESSSWCSTWGGTQSSSSLSLFTQPSNHTGARAGKIQHWPTLHYIKLIRWQHAELKQEPVQILDIV